MPFVLARTYFISFLQIVKGRGNEGFVFFVLFMMRNNGPLRLPLFECVECRTAAKNENCDVFSHWLWDLECLVCLYGSQHIKNGSNKDAFQLCLCICTAPNKAGCLSIITVACVHPL